MTEKYIPETPEVKSDFVFGHNGYDAGPGAQAEALATFNRWYSRELEEAREEGRQEERKRFETQAPEHGYVIFVAPYEFHHKLESAEVRLEELVDEGKYATLLKVVLAPHTNDALGLTVREPVIDVARQAEGGI